MDESSGVLMFRSVPWAGFRRYQDAVSAIFPGKAITVFAREPFEEKPPSSNIKYAGYSSSIVKLSSDDMRDIGISSNAFEWAVIPCHKKAAAPYRNLAEIALRAVTKGIIFLFDDLSMETVALDDGETTCPRDSLAFRKKLYGLVHKNDPFFWPERQLNYAHKVYGDELPENLPGNGEAGGVLLVYTHLLEANAATVDESIRSFYKYSTFHVLGLNAEMGIPPFVRKMRFAAIVLHYSAFYPLHFLDERYPEFRSFLNGLNGSVKVAFFQDEHFGCAKRFKFINEYGIDLIYSCFAPSAFKDYYFKFTGPRDVRSCIPSYVDGALPAIAARFSLPRDQRPVDIGYRGRPVPCYMGKGTYEKYEIGDVFAQKCAQKGLKLKLDIGLTSKGRLYGDDWNRFLGSCRGMLGVESGSDLVDIGGKAFDACAKLYEENPEMPFGEMYQRAGLARLDNNMSYRTISARHFEAAAFMCVQILFEGEYSGMMKPMVHYIPLKKDFSNFDEVIMMFNDGELCGRLVENAYNDLIASGRYTYESFISEFDKALAGHIEGK